MATYLTQDPNAYNGDVRSNVSFGGGGEQVPTMGLTAGQAYTSYTPQSLQTEPAPDPYALDRALFATQKQGLYDSANTRANSEAYARQGDIQDFIRRLTSGQKAIDERGVQNELAKKQGFSSVLDMVGQGLRSGGTMLANRNAADSSAAQGLAMAYGRAGNQQLGKIGNQYGLENRNIGLAQDVFNTERAVGIDKFGRSKKQTVDDIVGQAQVQLQNLQLAMQSKSLPEQLQIQQEMNNIRAQAEAALGQYDAELAGANSIGPASQQTNQQTAYNLANQGVAAINPFDFTATGAPQFQGQGPAGSSLPIFTTPRKRT